MSQEQGLNVETLLPEPFKDLEDLARVWSLPTETERSAQRNRSSREQLAALNDSLLPRIEAVFAYLDQFNLDSLPDDAKRLLFLTLSLAEIAPMLHFYNGEPPAHVLDSSRLVRWDVPHMTPAF